MTFAPNAPSLRFETLEEAIGAVRKNGLRLSTARRLVLEALFAADGPVAAPYLVDTLSIDESSVYRNLEALESLGVVRHVHLGHGPGLYVLVGGDEVEYLYCERCGKVTPVAPERLHAVRDAIRGEFGYQAQFTHFAIVGFCADCVAQPDLAVTITAHTGTTGAEGPSHGHPTAPDADPHHSDGHTHSHGGYVHSHPHSRTARPHSH